MKIRLLTFLLSLLFISSNGQLIQGTIKPGPANNQIEVWIKPGFTNSTEYLFQLGFPIAFPAAAVQPTGLTVTQDASFIATFGNNYTPTVNAVAHNMAGTENYLNIVLIRGGAGASNAQNWTAGTEYKVLTATFAPVNAPGAQVKLADYQDGGSDGLGNFYTQSGTGSYYVSSNSAANFYATPGESIVAGTASAGFVQTIANISLPVGLLKFSGYKNGNKNTLLWSTSDEMNNKGFEVQRSTDGTNYVNVGFVRSQTANGNSSLVLAYSFDDIYPEGKRQYYRLRQVDIDGRGKLSSVVMIYGEKPITMTIGGMFPNPAIDRVNVIINAPSDDKVELILTDITGKIIRKQMAIVGAGTNSIGIDIGTLTRGSYFIQLNNNKDKIMAAKFMKQ